MNTERINIHELTVEEPEKQTELPFDPERDLTEEDWRKMIETLEELKKSGAEKSYAGFSRVAAALKILDPQVDLKLDEAIRQEMRDRLVWQKKNSGPSADIGAKMKITDPQLGIEFSDFDWQVLDNYLDNYRNHKNDSDNWQYFAKTAVGMKILNPERDLNLTEIDWEGMREKLNKSRDEKNWPAFLFQAVEMKILDPSIDLDLNKSVWHEARKILNGERERGIDYSFCEWASYLKILAAETVQVTNTGLKITMPKLELGSKELKLPDTKKF